MLFSPDFGSQLNMLISPELWRAFFKPAYAEMFSKVKGAGMDVWMHSDGYIPEIIPDFIEMGVDVLNCQSSIIGLERLQEFAGSICFRTDLDRQNIMPYDSPSEVKDHIFATFDALGTSQGGIVACGEIGEDVPLENIRAMYEAFLEYRC